MTGDYDELILLPIPTTKDNIHVKGSDLTLSEISERSGHRSAVCGYGLPDLFREELESRGAQVFDGLYSEDFLVENALLTVDGALGEILKSFDSAPRELSIGVIGYGRIGKRLLEVLLFLGGRVKVYTRSARARCELGKEGIESGEFVFDGDYSGIDLLINTAPTVVMSEEKVKECEEKRLQILDLASGECFPTSPIVKKLASIPELFYPKSAGRLYAKYISEFLRLEKK
jgi:hypothetical protein